LENDDYMIVMQYAKQGSLRNLLYRKFYDLKWMNKIENLLSIAEGLYAIHKDGFIHKDLHPGNIVNEDITSSYITDFGLCKPVNENSSSKKIYGVLPYIAPEVLNKDKYTQKSDIYSYGIIMTEIFNGYPPYHNLPHCTDLAIKICYGLRPEIKRKIPSLLMVLMNNCLDADPQVRPNAKELVDKLKQYRQYLTDNKELHEQIEAIEENKDKSSVNNQHKSAELSYQIHQHASYKSNLQDYQNLPGPVNNILNLGD
ncbi:kinase-like domain-containing protein, partial [Gigaspora rosea]